MIESNFHVDNWGHENNYSDNTGVVQGFIRKTYPESHRADIVIYESGSEHVLPNVRIGSPWTGGPNTGIHALPRPGTPVQVLLKRPSQRYWSNGYGKAEVIGINFASENPPPQHISQKDEINYYAFQSHMSIGEDISPSSFELRDDKGGIHTLDAGKTTQMSMGTTDNRAKGVSLTGSEKKSLDASNSLSVAFKTSKEITNIVTPNASAEVLNTMSASFNSMARSVDSGAQAMSQSSVMFGSQLKSQTKAASIALNASNLSKGITDIDTLEV